MGPYIGKEHADLLSCRPHRRGGSCEGGEVGRGMLVGAFDDEEGGRKEEGNEGGCSAGSDQ
jgi:hypothetical protein